jgi:sigma-E factor negative regulatory protein RseA
MIQETGLKREQVSALVDGQLHGDEFVHAVDWLAQEDDARLTWNVYHVVGEVLRTGQAMDSTRDAAFLARLKLGLKQEAPQTALMNATDLVAVHAISAVSTSQFYVNSESANDSRFRWKLLAGFASLAAVAVIGWQAVGAWEAQRGESQLAQVPVRPGTPVETVVQITAGTPQVMIRDSQLDALLAAHRQFGGTSALQMPAGFLRNATFEGAGR